MYHYFTICLFVSFVISNIMALKCAPSACDTVRCRNPESCHPGESLQRGGHCLCCNVCKKIIGEGEYCGSGSPIGGVVSDTVICEDGLYCRKDICQKIET